MAFHKMDGVDGTNYTPNKYVRLYGVGAITAGNCVMIDPSDTTNGAGYSVAQCDLYDSACSIGIAMETTTTSGYLQVQIGGYCTTATADGAIALRNQVGSDTTTDGRIKKYGTEIVYFHATGGAAGNLTVTGITTNDEIIAVLSEDATSGKDANLTAEFSITAADTINNGTGGTASTGNAVKVFYSRNASNFPFGLCVDAFSDGKADGIILIRDQGYFHS